MNATHPALQGVDFEKMAWKLTGLSEGITLKEVERRWGGQTAMDFELTYQMLQKQREIKGLGYADIGYRLGNPSTYNAAYQMGRAAFQKARRGNIGKGFFKLLEVLQMDFLVLPTKKSE